MSPDALTDRAPAGIDAAEWAARVELAACYRLFGRLGWHEMIYNHITLRVPGTEDQFLINPFGLMYREVTASNLVRIDTEGRVLDGSAHGVNPAGFIVHRSVHMARADAHCVMHTHTPPRASPSPARRRGCCLSPSPPSSTPTGWPIMTSRGSRWSGRNARGWRRASAPATR
jgi:hypothetical protein